MSEVGRRLLDLVYNTENGKRDYNLWNTQTQILPTKSMTDMTVQEVMDIQEQNLGNNGGAAGAGQIKLPTMKFLIKNNTLDANELFSPEAQDRAHMRLLRRRGLDAFERGDMPLDDFALELAKEYASFPLLSPIGDKKVGQSYYVGKAQNNALITPESFVVGLNNSLLAEPPEVVASDQYAANARFDYPPAQDSSEAKILAANYPQPMPLPDKGNYSGIVSAASKDANTVPQTGIMEGLLNFFGFGNDDADEQALLKSEADAASLAEISDQLAAGGISDPDGQFAGELFKARKSQESSGDNVDAVRQGLGMLASGFQGPSFQEVPQLAQVSQARGSDPMSNYNQKSMLG